MSVDIYHYACVVVLVTVKEKFLKSYSIIQSIMVTVFLPDPVIQLSLCPNSRMSSKVYELLWLMESDVLDLNVDSQLSFSFSSVRWDSNNSN